MQRRAVRKCGVTGCWPAGKVTLADRSGELPTFLLQSHLASQTLPTLRLSLFSFPGPPASFIPHPHFFLSIYSVSKEMAKACLS